MFSLSLILFPEVELLDDDMVVLFLVGFFFFKEPPYCSPKWLQRFTFPLAVEECSLFSTSSPAFVICGLLVIAIRVDVR